MDKPLLDELVGEERMARMVAELTKRIEEGTLVREVPNPFKDEWRVRGRGLHGS